MSTTGPCFHKRVAFDAWVYAGRLRFTAKAGEVRINATGQGLPGDVGNEVDIFYDGATRIDWDPETHDVVVSLLSNNKLSLRLQPKMNTTKQPF